MKFTRNWQQFDDGDCHQSLRIKLKLLNQVG